MALPPPPAGFVRMTNAALGAIEAPSYYSIDAYRNTFYAVGWRSVDDPTYAGEATDSVTQYFKVPTFWGEHWSAARNLAGSRIVRVMVIGDSIPVGEISSNWRTKGWPALLATSLQERYGDGGSGWISPAWSTIYGATNPGGAQVTFTGAWTGVANEGGITAKSLKPTTSGNGATITLPFRGTILDIFTKTDSAFGRLDYSIDGGGAVQIPLNTTASVKTTTVSGLSSGTHSVTLTAAAGDSRFYGVRGRNAIGVLVDNVSLSGQKLSDQAVGTTNILDPEQSPASVNKPVIGATLDALGPVDVLIVTLGANDAIFDEATTLQDSLWDALDVIGNKVIKAGPTLARPPEIIAGITHIGTADTLPAFALTKRDWAQICSVLRDWADAMGATVVDHWAQGRHSWSYWQSKTYWGNGNTDAVHPGDTGHAAYAAPYIELLR